MDEAIKNALETMVYILTYLNVNKSFFSKISKYLQ